MIYGHPRGNPYPGPITPYTYPPSHKQMPRPFVAPPAYTNVSPCPYYPYSQSSTLAPSILAP